MAENILIYETRGGENAGKKDQHAVSPGVPSNGSE